MGHPQHSPTGRWCEPAACRSPLHPRSRGRPAFERDARNRASGGTTRPDLRHARSRRLQRARPQQRHQPRRQPPHARHAAWHRAKRHPHVRSGLARPGHRACDRPRAGPDAAGQPDRLRRQPYLHPRRLRRTGLRHRRQRGRPCAGHPDPAPAQAENHAHQLHRSAGARHQRQGHDPLRHRRARYRRRTRPCDRIRRPRGACARPRCAPDPVQPVDRDGREDRHDRA